MIHQMRLSVVVVALGTFPIFVPCQKGPFDENGESDEFAFYPLKQGLRFSDPQKDKK